MLLAATTRVLVAAGVAICAAACDGSAGAGAGGPTDVKWACTKVSDDASSWQLNGPAPEDTTSVRRAVSRLRDDARRVSNPRVRRASVSLANALAWAADDDSRPGAPDADAGALYAYQAAFTRLDKACGYPTQAEDD